MKKVFLVLAMAFGLAACGTYESVAPATEQVSQQNNNETTDSTDTPLEVLVTFSILTDMVQNVGGSMVNVTTIVPIGEDPHEHEVTPHDVINATNADIIFFNGLYLEIEYDWFENLMATAGRIENVDFFAVTDGISYHTLRTPGMEDYLDPHAWMDPILGMQYVNNIATLLSKVLPTSADYFYANATAFNQEIYGVYTQWAGRFDNIPAERNMIITAEGAFRYFGYRFGVNNEFLWEINSEDEGTPEQFIRLISIINEGNPAYLFLESSIDPDYMEQVSQETGIPIFEEYLFTDSLSEVSGPAGTYIDFLLHNLQAVYVAFTR